MDVLMISPVELNHIVSEIRSAALKKEEPELALHRWLAARPEGKGVTVGIGHDAAAVRPATGDLVLKTDQLVEGVHFLRKEKPQAIGRKAICRALSDCGVFGARPRYALLSLAAPSSYSTEILKNVIQGVVKAGKSYGVSLIGGDLSRSPGPLTLSVSIAGFMENRRPSLRSGASPGDMVLVTGSLGGSILGKHLRFSPRVKEGIHLAGRYSVHSAIDISDGLLIDLWRLCQSSRVGAVLDAGDIPVSAAARRLSKKSRHSPLSHALRDGEDYELLFTMAKRHVPRILRDPVFRRCGVRAIGEITRKQELVLRSGSFRITVPPAGYVHRWS